MPAAATVSMGIGMPFLSSVRMGGSITNCIYNPIKSRTRLFLFLHNYTPFSCLGKPLYNAKMCFHRMDRQSTKAIIPYFCRHVLINYQSVLCPEMVISNGSAKNRVRPWGSTKKKCKQQHHWDGSQRKKMPTASRESCIMKLPKQPGTRKAYAIANRAMCDSDIVYGQAILINGWL